MKSLLVPILVGLAVAAFTVLTKCNTHFITRLLYLGGYTTKVPKTNDALRIGILGAASIASLALINPARIIPTVEIVAVASRDMERAMKFAYNHNITRVFTCYDELIKDPNIDAVYIPLPNALHYTWTIKAIQAGKHVLCEKPFTSNAAEALQVIHALQGKNTNGGANTPEQRFKGPVIAIEAFHWRAHPLALRVKEILRSGILGKVKYTSASMSIPSFAVSATDNRFNYNMSGGSLMDLGSYTISVSRWISIQDLTKDDGQVQVLSATPTTIEENNKIDNTMKAVIKYSNGVISNISCGFQGYKFSSKISIVGENGTLETFNFASASFYNYITITTFKDGNAIVKKESVYGNGQSTYGYQLEAFRKAVSGETVPGLTYAEEAIKNMQIIDRIYEKSGLGKRGL